MIKKYLITSYFYIIINFLYNMKQQYIFKMLGKNNNITVNVYEKFHT